MKIYIKKLLFTATVIAFTAIMPACKKQINLAPENATYDQVFWVNGENVNKALSGAYSMLRDAFQLDRSFFIFGDIAADNFAVGSDFWNYTSFLQSGNFNFNYAPYLEGSVKNWSRFYAIVTQCHQIIDNAPNIADSKFSGGKEEKDRMIGEAKFLRAYVFFYMQRVWGDVILTKTTFKDPTNIPPVPRSLEKETLDFCLNDLASASSLLDNSANKTHANKMSALALTAQIYAWRKDYISAEKYCDSVINNSPVSMETMENYKNIWAGNSQESIMEINMKYDAVSNEASQDFFSVFLNSDYINNKNFSSSSWAISEGSLALFDQEKDKRFGTVIEDAGDGDNMLTKYTDVNYYDPNNSNSYVVSNNLVLIRLADIYLLRAEARYKNGNQALALEDLKITESRAGLDDFTEMGEALFSEIANERRREFIGEGSNQFDLIRMEQLDKVFSVYSTDRIAKKGYFWPLDMRVLLKQDELLTQNEWWNNN
jgi:hypothetical protein